jgi:hypothetical protein
MSAIAKHGILLSLLLVLTSACQGIGTGKATSSPVFSGDDSLRVTFEVTGSFLNSTVSQYLEGDNRVDWVAGNSDFQCNLIVTLKAEDGTYQQVIINAIINSLSSASLPGLPHYGQSDSTIVRNLNPGLYYYEVNSTCSSWRVAAIPIW